jgi:hypothetical protein
MEWSSLGGVCSGLRCWARRRQLWARPRHRVRGARRRELRHANKASVASAAVGGSADPPLKPTTEQLSTCLAASELGVWGWAGCPVAPEPAAARFASGGNELAPLPAALGCGVGSAGWRGAFAVPLPASGAVGWPASRFGPALGFATPPSEARRMIRPSLPHSTESTSGPFRCTDGASAPHNFTGLLYVPSIARVRSWTHT